LDNCTLEHFDKHLTSPELLEFICAHDPNVTLKNQIKKLKKGKYLEVETAMRDGAPIETYNCRILVAFNCRNEPCKYNLALQPNVDTKNNVQSTSTERNIFELSVPRDDFDGVKPSELLTSATWVGVVCELFNIKETVPNPVPKVDQEMMDKADLLVKMLQCRLNELFNKRNVNMERRNHWAIKLALKNLSVVAAYMVLCEHVKSSLTCLDETKCLLTPLNIKFLACELYNNHIGAYLYYDNNLGEYIRSGKVSGEGFGKRHEQHLQKAKKSGIPESDFYLWYPTKDNVRAQSNVTRGTFDSLTQLIAAGFDKNSELAKCIDKSYDEGGVLILNEQDKTNISSSQNNNKDVLNKFHAFLAYEMEFGYDLAIAPSLNVSGSFGFESFVGLFG
jgi:hypothetical protein